MRDYSEIIKLIEASERILIFTHANMDGDALGSAGALCRSLRQMGKRAAVLIQHPCPEYLAFLAGDFLVTEAPFEADLSVAVDMGSDGRLEGLKEAFYKAPARLCIDHHVRTEDFCEIFVVDPSAAAAGCLVYELLKTMGAPIDLETAGLLYAAVCTDTGSFRFSNTDREAMTMAGELIGMGVDSSALCTALFDSIPLCQLKLESLIIERARLIADGSGIVSWCTDEDYKACGALAEHAETGIDRLRSVRGVEAAALIKERDGAFKLSLRSKTCADVRSVASRFGGGGHLMAAGATLEMPLDEALSRVSQALEEELSRCFGLSTENGR